MLDYGIEQSLQIGVAADLCERRRALLNEKLACRAGLDFLQAGEKILARNMQPAQVRRRSAIRLQRRGGQGYAECDHTHFLAKRLEIVSHESVGMFRDLLKIDVLRERHGARMDLQNLQ